MKDILIVSNYYPPEKGAAANRIEQLALKLKKNGYSVSVVCPLGNYPKGKLFPEYRKKFSVTENQSGITIKRLWIYPSNSSNIFKRILSIASFSIGLFFYLLFVKSPKKVIVQSPPLLLSFIAVTVLHWKNKKIILNVSDLWPLAAIELGVLKENSISHKILKFLEKRIYQKATLIIGQSNEILTHISQITTAKTYLYRNFPDHLPQPTSPPATHRTIKLFYAGLLGVAQGVFELCENMMLPGNMELHIFGDGADKDAIIEKLRHHPESNITFHGMLDREELLQQLPQFDIAIVPLKTRIFGSVPSKIFEYGALGYPILYFGGGEGEDIVRQHDLGWVVDVENFTELNRTLIDISKLNSAEIAEMKIKIGQRSRVFDLEKQISDLIAQDVF